MRNKDTTLSPHSKKVLEVLHKSAKPMSAYELMDKLHKFGIKAPPTIYRALDTLVARGLVHRIETLSAFVACHDTKGDHDGAHFAVCRSCGNVEEIHDHRLSDSIKALAASIKFHIEREMLELIGLCKSCNRKAQA
jgi:Fur family zinc uptake transcriptional regulator